MSSSLLSLTLLCLVGFISAAPLETTDLPVEATTIHWISNADVRKHIDLINEFARVREELATATATPDDEMIPMGDINEGLEAAQTLIHKFFAIKQDLETKKKEYEMMTTTTVATTTPSRGFLKKLLDKIKFFD